MENDSVEETLSKLFAAELEARRLHDRLAATGAESGGRDAVVAAAVARIAAAEPSAAEPSAAEPSAAEPSASQPSGEQRSAEEATATLICVARLLGEFDGPDVADALIDVLDSEHPEVRSEAGEQLQGLAYDRFKEVALAVERALGRLAAGSNALVELPFVLAEIPEGGVTKLLEKFLAHADAEAVASALEALVEVGDPSALDAVKALLGDERRTRLRDDDADEPEVTLGELAADAVELLGQG